MLYLGHKLTTKCIYIVSTVPSCFSFYTADVSETKSASSVFFGPSRGPLPDKIISVRLNAWPKNKHQDSLRQHSQYFDGDVKLVYMLQLSTRGLSVWPREGLCAMEVHARLCNKSSSMTQWAMHGGSDLIFKKQG